MRLYRDRPSGTVDRARQLRRSASEPERRLLRALRAAFPDLKWRHQAPIGSFYADLLCFSEKLVLEVDGDTHVQSGDYDRARTACMKDEGFTVVRFANADVIGNLEGVLATISLSLREREGGAKRREGEGEGHRKGEPA